MTRAERDELTRILGELEMQPYQRRAMTRRHLDPGEARVTDAGHRAAELGIRNTQGNYEVTYNRTVANAPVYHAITKGHPTITGKALAQAIRNGLEGGRKGAWYRRALAVARKRLKATRRTARTLAQLDMEQETLLRDALYAAIDRAAELEQAVEQMYREQGVEYPEVAA